MRLRFPKHVLKLRRKQHELLRPRRLRVGYRGRSTYASLAAAVISLVHSLQRLIISTYHFESHEEGRVRFKIQITAAGVCEL